MNAAPPAPGTTAMEGFHDGFSKRVSANPGAIALVDAGTEKSWSYAELDAVTDRVANFLVREGASEDRSLVLSVLPNSVEALVVFLAALKAGIDFAPLSPYAPGPEIERAISLLRPSLCLVAEATTGGPTDVLIRNGKQVRALALNGTFDWAPEKVGGLETPQTASRIVLSTSGSTGEPKAIVIDSDRLWASGNAFLRVHDFVRPNSRFFNCLPMYYLAGLYNLGLIPLAAGAATVVGEAFSGRMLLQFWKTVAGNDVDVLWLVPTIVRSLLAIGKRNGFDPAMVRKIHAAFLGTAPIDLATKAAFEREFGIPLLENYALSETVFLTSESLAGLSRRIQSSVGTPLPEVELCFQSPPEDGDTGPTQEVLVKTPYLFLGYLDAAGNISLPLRDDGYFATGDLGHRESDGTIVLDGRLRDIVKKGGAFVALREIECLAESLPEVREAVAVKVAHEILGEDYILFVHLAGDPPAADPDAVVLSVRKILESRLSRQKWPGRIVSRDEFPRTPSGKVRKHLLEREMEEAALRSDAAGAAASRA